MNQLTVQFNDLFTSTLWRYQEKLADNITSGSALLQRLREKGCIAPSQHGTYIAEPVLYSIIQPLQWLSPYQPADLRPHQATTVVFYPFRKAVLSVTVSGEEVRANRTPAALMELIRTKIQVLEMSFSELLNRAIAALSADVPANAMHSLDQIVSDTVVVGNIDPATHSWWKSYVASGVGAISWQKIGGAIINNLVFGSRPDMAPDLILLPPDLWDSLHNQLTNIQRAEADARSRDISYGFATLYWRGIPVVMDKLIPSGYVFILNTNFLRLRHRPGEFFNQTPMRYDERQDIHFALIRLEGNLVTNNRRMHGKLTGVTP
jgi:hypothetical protein